MSTRIHFSGRDDDHVDVTAPPEQVIVAHGHGAPVRLAHEDGIVWVNPKRIAYWAAAPEYDPTGFGLDD
ncbi:MAG TPA: hypothetical protein VGM33_12750 [Baekduia sp.]|jgi:hypothetical protein